MMTPRPSDETAATVGRPRRKRFSLAGLNLGSNSKASEKGASAKCHNDGSSASHNREDRKTGTSTNHSSSRGVMSHQSPKTLTNAATDTVNSTLSAATAVASRDPKARRGSLPIFDRTCTKKEPVDSRKGGKGDPLGGGGGSGDSAVAPASAVASEVGGEVTANTEFERRGPPRRRHSASATQIEAISRQAFGGGDAAAYESDSSDSSAWLDSDSDDED